MAEVQLVLKYLDVPLCLSRKLPICILLSTELTVICLKLFLRKSNFWLCPFDWNVDGLNMPKVQLGFLICWFWTRNIPKVSLRIRSTRSSSRCSMSFLRFFVDVVCCVFDQFLMRYIDGKYLSVTAPLVLVALH